MGLHSYCETCLTSLSGSTVVLRQSAVLATTCFAVTSDPSAKDGKTVLVKHAARAIFMYGEGLFQCEAHTWSVNHLLPLDIRARPGCQLC